MASLPLLVTNLRIMFTVDMCHHFAFGGKRQDHHFFSTITPLKATSTLLSKPLKKHIETKWINGQPLSFNLGVLTCK
jgi:hypothetical protein